MRLIADEGVLEPRDAASDPFVYIAAEVPPGASGITVTLSYDDPGPSDQRGIGNILDLGLFGPGPLDIGTPAFRGWSGSERSRIVVGDRVATPGYLPGPVQPGRWHIVLGLCQISPTGCRYRVETELLQPGDPRLTAAVTEGDGWHASPDRISDPITPVDGRRDRLDPAGDPWWPGDLHCQTIHSDGRLTVESIARFARAAGLAFLFVSDHNTTSHRSELAAAGVAVAIALHPAEEVTTYRGHMGALGSPGWIDFRLVDPAGIAAAVDAVHQGGGLTVRNHPASAALPWEFGPLTHAIEVWNGPWDGANRNEQALAMWSEELANGLRTIAVGGSDMHDVGAGEQPIGTPITWVRAPDPGQHAVLDGLRAGRVVLSRTIDGPRVDILAEADDPGGVAGIGDTLTCGSAATVTVTWHVGAASGAVLRVLAPRGVIASTALDADDATGTLELPPGERPPFVRFEVRATDGALLAMTQPIHLEERA